MTLDLARAEFALTVVFHYLLVALTLGLVLLVAITYTRWVRTGDPVLEKMTRFWGLLYVVNYAVGIGAGLAMEFQLGMNWAGLENLASSVFGAPLAVETIVAFFAESTFLALWIFGWRRIPPKLHLACIWLVVVSAYMSAIWALFANGFLNHPVGYTERAGVLELTDVGALLMNSNAWIAIGHIVGAAVATGGFFVLCVTAFLQRRGRADQEFLRRSFRTGAHAAGWGSILAVGVGALQLEAVVKEQPVKFAAFISSDEKLAEYAVELRQKFGEVDMPPTGLVRYSALTMMVIGALMLIFGIWALIAIRRDRILSARALPWILMPFLALPFLANIAGWVFREVGRQPYAIYQLLSTKQALTPSLTAADLMASLVVFVTIVAVLLVLDVWLLARIARRGPDVATDLWGAAPDELPAATRTPTGAPPCWSDRDGELYGMETLWLVAFGVLFAGYLVLAGVDYGAGILLPYAARTDGERQTGAQRGRAVPAQQRGVAARLDRHHVRHPAGPRDPAADGHLPAGGRRGGRGDRAERRGAAAQQAAESAPVLGRVICAGGVAAAFGWGAVLTSLAGGLPLDAEGHVTSRVRHRFLLAGRAFRRGPAGRARRGVPGRRAPAAWWEPVPGSRRRCCAWRRACSWPPPLITGRTGGHLGDGFRSPGWRCCSCWSHWWR